MKTLKPIRTLLATIALFWSQFFWGQNLREAPILQETTLPELIDYAFEYNPKIHQVIIDEAIGERDIKSNLSGWFPQVNLNADINHVLEQQESNQARNSSDINLELDQQILNTGLWQATKAKKYIRKQYEQNTKNERIQTIVAVSKAYYNILVSQQQVTIISENILRLEKQFEDAQSQYEEGLVDKTDFQRAQISLTNSKADLKRAQELLSYKYTYLKELIGYESGDPLTLASLHEELEQHTLLDTTSVIDYRSRIEYQQVETQKNLQEINTRYAQLQFLPNISGFINYDLAYQNNHLNSLYRHSYRGSVVGVRLNLPIFQGTKQHQEIQKSKLQEERIDYELISLKNQINSQFEQALALYKSSLNDWKSARKTVEISEEVYATLKLQYDEGIKTYLDLMTSETDLRTSKLNYTNTLYNLLSAKLDVEQALGIISI